ncbi:dATP/dGTP pyrophosphohydrolase domain-containing protein [Salmonella enterica]
MNNKLTDERPDDEGLELLITIRREIAERHASEGRMEQCAVHTLILNALLELQERRKADSDPVGEFYEDGTLNWYQISDGDRVPANRRIPLYRHAQPVPEREQIRREHAEWSDATFGDVGPIGPLKHLSKEALEAAAEPGDLSEWSDMQFLLWDVLRRAGNTPVQSPIDHGYRPECECSGCKATARICAELAGSSTVIGIDPASGPDRTVEVHYVAPPGYVMVPKVPTDEMIAAAMECDDVTYNESDDTVFYVHHREIYKAMLATAPQPEVK